MRAGIVLEALTTRYSVSLLAVKLRASPEDEIPERFARICCRAAAVSVQGKALGLWSRFQNRSKRPGLTEVLRQYQTFYFDAIHVFRLAMLPFSQEFIRCSSEADRRLDLDEVESAMHNRIAQLSRGNGDLERAAFEEAAAARSAYLERQACAMFRCIYVSSRKEEERFSALYPAATLAELPNGVRLPDNLPSPTNALFTFLFAGTLGYYPNEDAVLHLSRDIVPRIRQTTNAPFEIDIVGPGASPRLQDEIRQAGLNLVGSVADIQPHYRRAAAVIVPIRAGAGTRIKILEAWAYRRPVVTTTAGIEGLPGCHETHALIADAPDSFAEHCVRLMKDPELAARLAANGHALVERSFSLAAIERAIAASAGQAP
jgi:glycosyltransferase involved in cell wall biosynthesis